MSTNENEINGEDQDELAENGEGAEEQEDNLSPTAVLTITTENKQFSNYTNDKGKKFISVKVNAKLPTNIQELQDFFGGESALIKVGRQEVARRLQNAARPILREAEQELDWQAVAQEAVDSYEPGRRGGGFRPKVAASELEGLDTDQILELLMKRGVVSA